MIEFSDMPKSSKVSANRIADEPFLIATTIERCPKTMMIRELFMNAIEASIQASEGKKIIELKSTTVGYPPAMSDKESDQRRDDLLLRLLKTPPEPRAERKHPRTRPDAEASQKQPKGSSVPLGNPGGAS